MSRWRRASVEQLNCQLNRGALGLPFGFRGDAYRELIEIAHACSREFSLTMRDQLDFSESAKELSHTLEPWLLREIRTDCWPGTTLLGSLASVRHYEMSSESAAVLATSHGLYHWLAPNYPEDLVFYSAEGNWWFCSIAHESQSFVQLQVLEKRHREIVLEYFYDQGWRFDPWKVELSANLTGRDYQDLLTLAGQVSAEFSLCFDERRQFSASALALENALAPWLMREVRTDDWPGAVFAGDSAELRYYRVSPSSIAILASAPGLYSWSAPHRPADLSFHTMKGKCWLHSIGEQTRAVIQLDALDDPDRSNVRTFCRRHGWVS